MWVDEKIAKTLMLLRHRGCVNASLVARALGVSKNSAYTILRNIARSCNVERSYYGVVCVKGAVPKLEMEAICRYIASTKSKMAFVSFDKLKKYSASELEFVLYIAALEKIGARIERRKYKNVALIDVERAGKFCKLLQVQYDVECRPPSQPQRRGRPKILLGETVVITLRVPTYMRERMDILVSLGKYRSYGEVVRAALEDMLARINQKD